MYGDGTPSRAPQRLLCMIAIHTGFSARRHLPGTFLLGKHNTPSVVQVSSTIQETAAYPHSDDTALAGLYCGRGNMDGVTE